MDKPKFLLLPTVRLTAEAYYEDSVSELDADKYGSSREKAEFENAHLWYLNEDKVETQEELILIYDITNVRPASDNGFTILSHGTGEDHREVIIPIPFKTLLRHLRSKIEVFELDLA